MRAYGPRFGLTRRELVLAFAVAIAVRLAMLVLVAYRFDTGDSFWYDQLAKNLIAHDTFSLSLAPPIEPTFYRPPLFPFLVSLIYRVWHAPLAVQLVQVLISAVTAIVFAKTVEQLATRVARPAMWLAVLVPANAVYAGTLLAETFTTFFLVLAVALPVLWKHRASWFAMGATLGLCVLTRDVYLALIPFFAILLPFDLVHGWVEEARLKRRIGSAVLVVVGAIVAIGPWTLRNYDVAEKIIPVSKGILGQGLWIGTWEVDGQWLVDGGFEHGPPEGSFRTPEEKAKVEAALLLKDEPRDKAMRELAFDRYREEPLAVLGRWLWRAPQMWLGTRFDIFAFRPTFLAYGAPAWWVVKAGLFAVNGAIVLLGLVGLVVALLLRSWLAWLAIPVVYNAGIFLPLHSTEPRYSQPVYLFVCAFAAYLVVVVYDRWRAQEPSKR